MSVYKFSAIRNVRAFMLFGQANSLLLLSKRKICGYGGIGRRAGLRIRFERVQVQALLTALLKPPKFGGFIFLCCISCCIVLQNVVKLNKTIYKA